MFPQSMYFYQTYKKSKKRKRRKEKREMVNLRSHRFQLYYAFQLLILLQTKVLCFQHKVGDLDAWGIPTSANPQVYAKWSKYNTIKIGDSLCKSSIFIPSLISLFLCYINISLVDSSVQCFSTHQVKIQ